MTDHAADAAEEMRELERLWRDSPHSSEFQSLRSTSKWGESIRQLVVAGIEANLPTSVEDGIIYLEVSPRYFRSGYHKAIVASKLKSVTLAESQKERLRKVIIAACESQQIGPEFNEYARLAVCVADDNFVSTIAERVQDAYGWSRSRWQRLDKLCRQ